MRSIFSNVWLLVFVAIGLAVAGAVAGYQKENFMWFSRCGSLIVGIGIVILSRTFIVGADLKTPIMGAETGKNVMGREHYNDIGEKVPDFVVEDEKSRFSVGIAGPITSFVGSVVWGFGDLLNYVFDFEV